MPEFTDQSGRKVFLKNKPKRIVSTVPSQTELLYDLGLYDEVIGITAYCVHPPEWRSAKNIIGGTKDLNIDLIKKLQPDLIIGNKEENVKDQIEELAEHIPVWLSDISTIDEALEMIVEVGKICGKEKTAKKLTDKIQSERSSIKPLKGIDTLYLIWKDPYMLAGKDSFISNMLRESGMINKTDQLRYPELSIEELKNDPPALLFLCSEPYSFSVLDMHQLAQKLPDTVIKIVDGEMFSWYGSRLIYSFKYLKRLILELQLVFHK